MSLFEKNNGSILLTILVSKNRDIYVDLLLQIRWLHLSQSDHESMHAPRFRISTGDYAQDKNKEISSGASGIQLLREWAACSEEGMFTHRIFQFHAVWEAYLTTSIRIWYADEKWCLCPTRPGVHLPVNDIIIMNVGIGSVIWFASIGSLLKDMDDPVKRRQSSYNCNAYAD